MLKQKKNGKVTKEENMYIFNRITVVPQLPKELKRLSEMQVGDTFYMINKTNKTKQNTISIQSAVRIWSVLWF